MKDANKLVLEAQSRSAFGKKLKKLRHQGVVPGNIYGQGMDSLAFQIDSKALFAAYKTARETGVVYLTVDGKEIPAMFKHMQRHPLSHAVLHVDMRKVNLKQKIETQVPVAGINEAPGVKLGGVLLTQADTLVVEALPADIPQSIEVDLTLLAEIGSEVRVKDIKPAGNYTITSDPEQLVFSVVEHKEESLEPETTSEEPAVGDGETAEGEAASEAPAAEETPAENE